MEGFALVGSTQAAAQVKDGVVIVQGRDSRKDSNSLKPLLISGGSDSWDSQ